MKVFLLMILLALSSFAVTGAQAGTQFETGFESGGLSGLRCSGNCPRVTSKRTAKGRYASEFTLTPAMKTSYRTEAVFGKKKGHFEFGKEYWFEFDYRYEDWAKDPSADTAPFQMHRRMSTWNKRCSFKNSNRSGSPLIMTSKNGEVRLLAYNNKVLWKGPIQMKKWINLKVHLRVSSGRDGFIEAWKDGVKVGRVNGPNYAKKDACGRPTRSPYLKVGIYKWDWKKGRKRSKTSRRQLLIDNLKITKG